MKYLLNFLCALLLSLASTHLLANSNSDVTLIEKQESQAKHGKNGKDGKFGEDGEDGEDGQNGGNGGNGGTGWLRGGNGGNGGNAVDSSDSKSQQANQQVDELEYSTLKEMCRQVILMTISKFHDPLDNACLLSYKGIISTYLIQIGTPAARKIWQEYESVKWSYPDVLSI